MFNEVDVAQKPDGSDPQLAFLILAIVTWMGVLALAISAGSVTERGQWLLSGIPAWLQGLGTVGAVWFAYAAFENWRKEEVARDVATSAKALIRSVHRLVTVTRLMRDPTGTMHRPERVSVVRHASQKATKERIDEVDRLVKEIRGELEILGKEMFGEDLTREMQSLCTRCNDVSTAGLSVKFLEEELFKSKDEEVPGTWQEDAEESLSVLGYRFRGPDRRFSTEDESGQLLEVDYVSVMKGLRKKRGFAS
jgi:hypothetical protein